MKAVILAGGLGIRLRPIIGNDIQKVMLKYSDRPLLHRTVDILREKGFKEIVIVVSHLKEQIINYFGDGDKFSVNIEYVVQENPKGGTADAVHYVKEKINEKKFLLIYGDNIFHPKTLDRLIDVSDKYDGVMCGKIVENPTKFGILEVEKDRVIKIHEKPEIPPSNIANTGLFVLPKDIFSTIAETKLSPRGEYELTDSIQMLIDKGYKFGFVIAKEFWFDPRNEEEVKKAEELIKREK